MKPLIWTRRIEVACDVAQNSAESSQPVAPGTLIVRLASERQKLTSAVQLLGPKHWLWTLASPLIVTSFGDAPKPATSV